MGIFHKKILQFFEYIYVRFADIVVVDNKVIKDYVLQRYKLNAVFIPYGGDHTKAEKSTNELSATTNFFAENMHLKLLE